MLWSALGWRRENLGDLVVDFLHTSGERAGIANAADVHEVNLGLVEEEVVVEGRHLEACVERGAHRRVHLVFKHNSVAHHHDLCEGICAGAKAAHEPRPMKGGMLH